jgi:hypothetical protein
LGSVFEKILGSTNEVDLVVVAINALAVGFLGLGAAGVIALAPILLTGAAIAALAVIIGLLAEEISAAFTGQKSLVDSVGDWARALNTNGSLAIELFKSLILLATDFTDPAKWTRLNGILQAIGTAGISGLLLSFKFLGEKIYEYIGGALRRAIASVPLLGQALGGIEASAKFFGLGGAVDSIKNTLGAGASLPSASTFADLQAIGNSLNPFAGAPAPGVASRPAIDQKNYVTINATTLNAEEVAGHVNRVLESHTQDAFYSVP